MDNLTLTQHRALELTMKLLQIVQGQDANAVSSALVTTIAVVVSKVCTTEAQAVAVCTGLSGDLTRNTLEFMNRGHRDV